jgi:hypothetical protein
MFSADAMLTGVSASQTRKSLNSKVSQAPRFRQSRSQLLIPASIPDLPRLRTAANVAGLCDEEHEEGLQDLLLTALECYCMQTELSDNVDLAVEGDPHRRKPALHARLRRIYREEGDREEHHCFRAIPHANAIAFQSRLKAAMTAAGIDMSLPFRHLFVIRRNALPSGAKTQQLCDTFKKAGGKFVSLSDDDLGLLVALQTMFKERPEGLRALAQAAPAAL